MSAVLDAVRKKYPAYAEVPDAQLTHALGSKYPVYREQDPDFDSEYMAVAQQAFRGPTESELALAEPRTPGGAQPPPALTPEPDTQSEAAQFWEDVNEPMWEIVKPLSEEEHKWLATEMTPGELRKVGMQESLGGLVNFFTSPLGVSTFGIGALPKMAQRAIALAFATTMAKHGGEAAGELAGELDKPEEQRDQIKIGRLIGDTAQMTGFSALGAIGAGGGRLTKPGLEWWRQEIKPLEMARQLVESPVVKANREAYIDAQARAGGKPIVETSTQPDRASTWAVDRAVEEFNARKAAEQRAQPQPKPTDLEYEGGELTDYRSPITDQTLPVPQADTSKPTAAIEPPKSSPPAAPVGTGDLPVKPEGRRQKAETASAMLGDYETLKEWNKAALAREVADQAPPGFYQLSILTQQRVRAMSAEEITKRFAAMMQTIKEVSGKQGADRATDLSKDAAYRLNSAVLYQEALKRGITRPIATLDEYVKSGQFAKQAKTETPDDIQEAAQTFTRTDALEEFRSRGMNVTTEMADLWAESQKLNSRFLDMRGRHEPGVTEVQKKLSTMDRRLDELAAAANPAIYKEGQELEYRMFPRDKPRKVVITGTSFDTINGRTYKFQEVGRPDAHFPGARAEQLGPVGIRNIDSEIARAQASAGAARANFNNMGKWRDLKSEDARRYWRQAKLEASGAEVELNKLIEEKKAIEARSKLTAPQPSSLVPRPSPPAGASPGQPPSNPPSLAMEGGAEAGPTPGTGSIPPTVEGRGSRVEGRKAEAAARPGDAIEVETTTAIDPTMVQTVEFPLDKLRLSKDVPNFKAGASEETGTVSGQELQGKYERRGTAPIVVWERLNGEFEVITGRHRLDLARRTGEKTIPAQVVRERDGFSKDQALTFDAEANIRDGQGEVADYATYFKGTNISEAEARARGLLSRAKGKAGWSLAKAASPDVYALWRSGKINEAQAVTIANAAPGDVAAQQIGSKFALQGKTADFLANVIKASKAEAGNRGETLDLFGNDDSAMQKMAEQAERASQFQKEIAEQIRAVQGAAKRPEIARKLGVDVKDPEGIANKVTQLKADLVRWDNWPMQPDLAAKVRGETPPKPVEPEPAVPKLTAQAGSLTKAEQRTFAELTEKLRAAREAGGPLLTTPETQLYERLLSKLGQGDLLAAVAVEQSGAASRIAELKAKLAEIRRLQERVLERRYESGVQDRIEALTNEARAYEAEAQKVQEQIRQLEREPQAPMAGEQELIGMGGAVSAEFRGGSATSIKNAQVDVERTRRGLPPAMQPARRDFGQVWDEAMARVDNDPAVQDRLITELKEKPRALTDLEDALLLHRQIDLQNAYARSTRELAAAYEDAGRFPNRLEDVERWKAETQRLSDALLDIYDVGKAAGTATGRGLNARKMLANEDFTLAEMEVGLRAAKEGRPLTDQERAKLSELEKNYRDLDARFNEYREKVETERATRMSTEAIEELKRKVASQPTYDPRILSIAEQIVGKLEKQADAARDRLRERLGRTSTGVDPSIVYDLGVIGAAKIARKGLDFTRWSAEMLSEWGDTIKPYLQAAWERANLHLDNEGAKYGDKSPQVKRLLRKRDEGSRRENIVDGLKNAAKEGQPLDLQGDFIRKLAESFVRGGIKEREALIDAVHDVLKTEFDPNITRRETMDAISGYGKFKPLNPDQVKATLRDLRGQMQQVAKLEDIQARKPLSKTGVERRTPSDEERRLLQQVNEAKRRFGVVVSDPARQLKSALDAVKTRLKNSIADLEWQLANQQKIVKTRTPAPSSPETQVLELRRDELRRQFEEMFPQQPLTDAQRADIAKRHLERNIADLEARIKGGDISIRQGRKLISTPELEALRGQRDALKAQHQELIDTLAPERRQQADLAALKARMAAQVAYYQDRMARGDFSKRPPPREIPMDRQALDLLAKRERVRTEYQRMKIHARLEARSRAQKLYGNLKEIINLPRTVWTAYDVSAVGRQGLVIGAGHPLRAAKSIGPMFRALASEQAALRYEQQILNRPNAALYRQSKLYIAPHEALTLSAMEEQIMSRFAHRIPGVRPSNRAFITYLNLLRADSFDAMYNTMVKRNGNVSAAELQAISNYINAATGRGNIYKAAIAGEFLATVFFSPRLVASRFQLLAGEPLMRGSWQTRRLIAQEYAQSLAGLGVIITLGLLAGATVEGDPRSSDFGKLKFGDTRVDVMAGLTQNAVLLSRLASGETKTLAGDVRPIRGPDVPYGSPGADDVIKQFLRTKLAPVPGMGLNVLRGENVLGEPVQPLQTMKEIVQSKSIGEAATRTGKAAWETLAPLSMRDIYEAMQRNGVPAGAALGVLSLFGAGLQVHEQHPAAEAVVSEKMRKVRGGSPEQRRELRENLVRTYQATAKTNAAFAKALEDQAQRIRLEQAFARTNKLQGAFNSPAGSTNRLLRAVGR